MMKPGPAFTFIPLTRKAEWCWCLEKHAAHEKKPAGNLKK